MANIINPLRIVLERLGYANPAIFPWDEVNTWPSGALNGLLAAGLLQQAQPMAKIACDGCEENCIMPITVYPAQEDKAGKAFITCDKREDIGRVHVDFRRMGQWQTTDGLMAAAIANLLGFSLPVSQAQGGRQWHIGTLKGKKHAGLITLVESGSNLALGLGGHTTLLLEALSFKNNMLSLDKSALIRMVDNPTLQSETETPEARRARLVAWVSQEKVRGTKAFLQIVADEEGISKSRLKQLIKTDAPQKNHWTDLLGKPNKTSQKKPNIK